MIDGYIDITGRYSSFKEREKKNVGEKERERKKEKKKGKTVSCSQGRAAWLDGGN